MALTAVTLIGCTIDKGGDEAGGTSSSSGTTPGDSETGEPTSTGGVTTGGPGDETSDSTAAPTTAPTSDPTTGPGDTTGTGDTTAGDTETGEGGSPCIDTPTVLTLDEVSVGGFSAEQLLEGKLGARMTTLTIASEPTTLSEQWKGKLLPLTVELRHEGGEVRWIDSEIDPDWDDSGNESGFPADCVDRMEIDVKIDFVTEGKEFDEHRDAVLAATTVERAEVSCQLMPPGLMGSLDPTTLYTPDDPMTVVDEMFIFGSWKGAQAGGNVMHQISVDIGGGIVGFGPLGSWGDVIDP